MLCACMQAQRGIRTERQRERCSRKPIFGSKTHAQAHTQKKYTHRGMNNKETNKQTHTHTYTHIYIHVHTHTHTQKYRHTHTDK